MISIISKSLPIVIVILIGLLAALWHQNSKIEQENIKLKNDLEITQQQFNDYIKKQ